MKRITFISALLILLISSCKIEDPENYHRTEAGLLAYAVTTDVIISPMIEALDISLKIDEYIKAPDMESKQALEDKYFLTKKVRLKGDTCRIIDNYATLVIDAKSILTEGAIWECYLPNNDTLAKMIVKCVGANLWEVETDYRIRKKHYYNPQIIECKSTITVSSSILPESQLSGNSRYQYSILGNGTYTETTINSDTPNPYIMSFSIVEGSPLVSRLSEVFRYFSGRCSMTIMGPGTEGVKEPVETELFFDKERNSYCVEITYKGFTEYWFT